MKRLVIIDGKSVFYRGYYAMGALSLTDGTPTGGIYGFAAISMEIVKKLNPTKVVVAWDSKSSTSKRRAIYKDYKAGRDRKSTRLNSSHIATSRMPSSAGRDRKSTRLNSSHIATSRMPSSA